MTTLSPQVAANPTRSGYDRDDVVRRAQAWADEHQRPATVLYHRSSRQDYYSITRHADQAAADAFRSNPTGNVITERVQPEPVPYVGMPATIHLVTDAMPAVVVRVNKRGVSVRRIPTVESTRTSEDRDGSGLPVVTTEGDTDAEPFGPQEPYTRVGRNRYRSGGGRGSVSLTLGKARAVTDYRM